MKQKVKDIARRLAPRWTTAVLSARARAHSHRVLEKHGNLAVVRELIANFGNTVLKGPFAGLRITSMAQSEQVGPYLLGTYESELQSAWQTVFQGSYDQIVDVGAKVGLYAVGLARRYPAASVFAFDTDWWARKAVREMSLANATPRVRAMGFCDPDWFVMNTASSALVISDCEGYEAQLFTPAAVAALRDAVLIIETHDCLVPGASEAVRAAFLATHDLRVLDDRMADRSITVSLDFLTETQRELAIHEMRPPQIWFLCLPRQGPNSHLRQAPIVLGATRVQAPAQAQTS